MATAPQSYTPWNKKSDQVATIARDFAGGMIPLDVMQPSRDNVQKNATTALGPAGHVVAFFSPKNKKEAVTDLAITVGSLGALKALGPLGRGLRRKATDLFGSTASRSADEASRLAFQKASKKLDSGDDLVSRMLKAEKKVGGKTDEVLETAVKKADEPAEAAARRAAWRRNLALGAAGASGAAAAAPTIAFIKDATNGGGGSQDAGPDPDIVPGFSEGYLDWLTGGTGTPGAGAGAGGADPEDGDGSDSPGGDGGLLGGLVDVQGRPTAMGIGLALVVGLGLAFTARKRKRSTT
ncbi:MAG: hypothetical protein KY455_10145 [Euryarchaeota archaeon]|nr:hypothetical protein [Euryarchaeota archaeon]